MLELQEVFKDFDITVRSWTYRPKYTTTRLIVPKDYPKIVTLEDLENYVQRLAERYPERNFNLKKIRLRDPAQEANHRKWIRYYQTKLFKSVIDRLMPQRHQQELQQLPCM